jgi:hypothetical protein
MYILFFFIVCIAVSKIYIIAANKIWSKKNKRFLLKMNFEQKWKNITSNEKTFY